MAPSAWTNLVLPRAHALPEVVWQRPRVPPVSLDALQPQVAAAARHRSGHAQKAQGVAAQDSCWQVLGSSTGWCRARLCLKVCCAGCSCIKADPSNCQTQMAESPRMDSPHRKTSALQSVSLVRVCVQPSKAGSRPSCLRQSELGASLVSQSIAADELWQTACSRQALYD